MQRVGSIYTAIFRWTAFGRIPSAQNWRQPSLTEQRARQQRVWVRRRSDFQESVFVCSGPRALGSDGLEVSLGLAATRLDHGLRAAAFWARLLRKGSDWGGAHSPECLRCPFGIITAAGVCRSPRREARPLGAEWSSEPTAKPRKGKWTPLGRIASSHARLN